MTRPSGIRAASFGVLAAVALALGAVVADRLSPPDLSRWHLRSTTVLAADGQLLRAFPAEGGQWRLAASRDAVDPLYLAMLFAFEDRRFGLHPGVDPLAALRALGQAAAAGRVVSGASTLTMQTARLLAPQPRTFGAKIEQALRALQLQHRLGQAGVLDAYLTLAPFGGAIEGVATAAHVWFGKSPARLTPAEAALLVALPQSPERLRPDRNPEAARSARNRVLDRAVAAGLLVADKAAEAKREPLPTALRALPMLAPHLSERLAAAADKGAEVRTTIDAALQRALEAYGRRQLAQLEPGANLAAVVVANRERKVVAHLGSGDWQTMQIDLTQAVRSPGSTLKPFIYAFAFDDLSAHPGTMILDAPLRFGDWAPRNFDQDFHGYVTAREALQQSLNMPAVQILEQVGASRFAALLQLAGMRLQFPGAIEPSLPLALGGVGVRLADLAMLMATLSEGGRAQPLRVRADQAPPEARAWLGSTAARATINILEGSPLPDGFAASQAVARERRVAFKTGTSFGFRDAWTIGASSDYTVAVWIGRPDGAPRAGETGRRAAAPVMFGIFAFLPADRQTRPAPPDPSHALFRRLPPPALQHLRSADAAATVGARNERLRILFPPDGATVESSADGIALSAAGGRAPLRWIVDGLPLAPAAQFWTPDGAGLSRLVVVDADGNRRAANVRILRPASAP